MVARKKPEVPELAAAFVAANRANTGPEVLVFGASNVALVEALLSDHRHVTVIDIRSSAFDKFSHLNSGLDCRLVELGQEFRPFAKQFDTVLFYDTLHHVKEKALALEQVRRVLRANGTILLYEPNISSRFRREYDQFGELKQSAYKLCLARLLEKNGFTVTVLTAAGIMDTERSRRWYVRNLQATRLDPFFRILFQARLES